MKHESRAVRPHEAPPSLPSSLPPFLLPRSSPTCFPVGISASQVLVRILGGDMALGPRLPNVLPLYMTFVTLSCTCQSARRLSVPDGLARHHQYSPVGMLT